MLIPKYSLKVIVHFPIYSIRWEIINRKKLNFLAVSKRVSLLALINTLTADRISTNFPFALIKHAETELTTLTIIVIHFYESRYNPLSITGCDYYRNGR